MCNLASLAVNMYVKPDKTFDFEKLRQVTKVVTRNLNKIIDINFYPVEEVRISTAMSMVKFVYSGIDGSCMFLHKVSPRNYNY